VYGSGGVPARVVQLSQERQTSRLAPLVLRQRVREWEGESERLREWERGRVGKWETGRVREWESGRVGG
jgi:hypothetical protein